MAKTVYEKNGYKDRKDYLESLVVEYNVPEDIVFSLADLLGPNEDFDGLVNAIEDYAEGGL